MCALLSVGYCAVPLAVITNVVESSALVEYRLYASRVSVDCMLVELVPMYSGVESVPMYSGVELVPMYSRVELVPMYPGVELVPTYTYGLVRNGAVSELPSCQMCHYCL